MAFNPTFKLLTKIVAKPLILCVFISWFSEGKQNHTNILHCQRDLAIAHCSALIHLKQCYNLWICIHHWKYSPDLSYCELLWDLAVEKAIYGTVLYFEKKARFIWQWLFVVLAGTLEHCCRVWSCSVLAGDSLVLTPVQKLLLPTNQISWYVMFTFQLLNLRGTPVFSRNMYDDFNFKICFFCWWHFMINAVMHFSLVKKCGKMAFLGCLKSK